MRPAGVLEDRNCKNFPGLRPWTPLGGSDRPQTPRSDTTLLRNVVLGRYATYLLNVNISRIFLLRILTPYPPMSVLCRFSKYAESFSKDGQRHDIIETAGISTMILLYDGNDKEGLVNLRKKVLLGKVIKAKSFVVPGNLPHTMSATKFHSFRAYFQVMTWKGNELPNPEDWGWYKKHELLYPVLTDLAPAPEYLLKIIRCACKTGCSNFQCQCKKNGLPCSDGCGVCQTTNCCNVPSY